MSYDEGDHVEISIPDPSDLDHRFHGYRGEIVDILEDDLSSITGEPEDDFLYTVDLEQDGRHDFRYKDLTELD